MRRSMFSLSPDPSRNLIRIAISGLLCKLEVTALAKQLAEAVAATGVPLRDLAILVETPGNVLQAQEVVAALGQMRSGAMITPRVAVVCKGRLLRMQLRRILPPDRSAMFDTVAEAERWLGISDSAGSGINARVA